MAGLAAMSAAYLQLDSIRPGIGFFQPCRIDFQLPLRPQLIDHAAGTHWTTVAMHFPIRRRVLDKPGLVLLRPGFPKGRNQRSHCIDHIAPITALPLVIGRNAANLSHTLRSEEHTSELQSLMRISYAVF